MTPELLTKVELWLQDDRRGPGGIPDNVAWDLVQSLKWAWHDLKKHEKEHDMSEEPVTDNPVKNRDIVIQILDHPVHDDAAREMTGAILETLEQIRLSYEDPEVDCIVWNSGHSPRGTVQIAVLDRGEDGRNPGPNIWISRARFEDLLKKEGEWLKARTKWHGSPMLATEKDRADLLAQKCLDLTTEKEVHLREMAEMRQSLKDMKSNLDGVSAQAANLIRRCEDRDTRIRNMEATVKALRETKKRLEEERDALLTSGKDLRETAWVAGYQCAYSRAINFMNPTTIDFMEWEEKQK